MKTELFLLRTQPQSPGKHELHTTPEFRSHVARKLSELIDSAIEVGSHWEVQKTYGNKSGTPDDEIGKFFMMIPSEVRGKNQASGYPPNVILI